MAMLNIVTAFLCHGNIKGVLFMTPMDSCISISTPLEIITLICAAYAPKVITKLDYIIMAREIIAFMIKRLLR